LFREFNIRFDGPNERPDHRRKIFSLPDQKGVRSLGEISIQPKDIECLCVLLGNRMLSHDGDAHSEGDVSSNGNMIVMGHDDIRRQSLFGEASLNERLERAPVGKKDEGRLRNLSEGGGLP